MQQVGGVESPYFFETAKSLSGQKVAVQTSAKTVHQGVLTHVLPDLIVLEVCHVPFFIRTQEIVWITLARR